MNVIPSAVRGCCLKRTKLANRDGPLRQKIVAYVSHEKPTSVLTNQLTRTAANLVNGMLSGCSDTAETNRHDVSSMNYHLWLTRLAGSAAAPVRRLRDAHTETESASA